MSGAGWRVSAARNGMLGCTGWRIGNQKGARYRGIGARLLIQQLVNQPDLDKAERIAFDAL